MGKYLLKRFLNFLLILFCITIISFLIMKFSPGDPVEMLVDPETPKEVIEAKREALGLNAPLPVQYFRWLGRACRGDLGYSIVTHQKVTTMIGERIGPTALLVFSSLALAVLLSVPLGILSAVHQNSMLDHVVSGASLLFISLPGFFVSLLVVYLFALNLKLFPTGGMRTLGQAKSFGDLFHHMFLPMCVMAVNSTGVLVRYVRPSMLEILGQDYMRTARAKGLKENIIVYKHGLKNALNSIVTMLGVQIAYQLGGSVVIEQIFSWPGLGRLVYDSINFRDYAVVMGVNLFMGVVVLTVNTLVDLVYVAIDPRISLTK